MPLRMLLWLPKKYQKRSACRSSRSTSAHFCHMSLLIFTFSKYAISLWPLLSSKSSTNDGNHKHSWTAWFLSWSLNIVFSPKNVSNYKHSWSPWFLVGSTDFKNLHISTGNTHILERWWIRWFRIFFIIVVFSMEQYTFWSVHGFIIFDHISLLLHVHVLANIQNFDADLGKS